MCACEMTDLPGCSVATTSTCKTKLECFDQPRTHGKHIFKNNFLEIAFQLLEENYLLTKLEHQIFRETTVK